MDAILRPSRLLWVVTLSLVAASTVAAQTLGEIAKREEERRKTVKTSGKVYTNSDLRRYGPPEAPPKAPSEPATDERPAAVAPGTAGEPQQAVSPEAERDQAYWRQQFAAVRGKLETKRAMLGVLDARALALGSDLAVLRTDLAVVDPAVRAAMERDRERVVVEADRIRKEIGDLTKELAALEDDARRSNVPPGWIR